MKKLTKYFLIFHTSMLLITGIGMWLILKLFFPEMLVDGYIIIPLYFYILGLIFIWQFRYALNKKPTYLVNLYMLMRVIKVFTSFAIIFIYWLIDKPNLRKFAIIFIIFYLINLIWETYIYLRMEKYIKFKTNQKKQPGERECIDQ